MAAAMGTMTTRSRTSRPGGAARSIAMTTRRVTSGGAWPRRLAGVTAPPPIGPILPPHVRGAACGSFGAVVTAVIADAAQAEPLIRAVRPCRRALRTAEDSWLAVHPRESERLVVQLVGVPARASVVDTSVEVVGADPSAMLEAM